MIFYVISWVCLLASILSVALMRMVAWGSNFTYVTVALHLLAQIAIAGLCLWISALFGPLDAHTILMTGLSLFLEAVFRAIRRMRGG